MIGACPDTRKSYPKNHGDSALLYACNHRDSTLVSFLLQKGAKINNRTISDSPLQRVYLFKDEELARLLLSHGADPDKQLPKDRFGRTVWQWCKPIQQQMELKKGLKFLVAKVVRDYYLFEGEKLQEDLQKLGISCEAWDTFCQQNHIKMGMRPLQLSDNEKD